MSTSYHDVEEVEFDNEHGGVPLPKIDTESNEHVQELDTSNGSEGTRDSGYRSDDEDPPVPIEDMIEGEIDIPTVNTSVSVWTGQQELAVHGSMTHYSYDNLVAPSVLEAQQVDEFTFPHLAGVTLQGMNGDQSLAGISDDDDDDDEDDDDGDDGNDGNAATDISTPTYTTYQPWNGPGPFVPELNGDTTFSQVMDTFNTDMAWTWDSVPWDSALNPPFDNAKNFGVDEFISYWAFSAPPKKSKGLPPIDPTAIDIAEIKSPEKVVARKELTYPFKGRNKSIKVDYFPSSSYAMYGEKDLNIEADLQGILWKRELRTTREEAREVRSITYSNHRNCRTLEPQRQFATRHFKASFQGKRLPDTETYFQFRENNMKYKPSFSHFQLRHTIAPCGNSGLFFVHRPALEKYVQWDSLSQGQNCRRGSKIIAYYPQNNEVTCFMDLTRTNRDSEPRIDHVTALATGYDTAVAGSIEGVYALKSLSSLDPLDSPSITGTITTDPNSSTNHIHNIRPRTSDSSPQAIICSNDSTVRALDCTVARFVSTHTYPFPINCAATDPTRRLRLLVGDDVHPLLVAAETGRVLHTLPHHMDFGFACAIADDGVSMATGHQDGVVRIWDARNIFKPIHTLAMEMGGCRAMEFSPVGSGQRVLVLAEPADFVHVVDARTYDAQQSIDFFGEIAGISMPASGEKLWVANADERFGGLMEFERAWNGGGYHHNYQRPSDQSPQAQEGSHLRPNRATRCSSPSQPTYEESSTWRVLNLMDEILTNESEFDDVNEDMSSFSSPPSPSSSPSRSPSSSPTTKHKIPSNSEKQQQTSQNRPQQTHHIDNHDRKRIAQFKTELTRSWDWETGVPDFEPRDHHYPSTTAECNENNNSNDCCNYNYNINDRELEELYLPLLPPPAGADAGTIPDLGASGSRRGLGLENIIF